MLNKLLLALSLFLFCCTENKKDENLISKDQIETMFKSLKADGIDTNKELLWGYFFFDNDSSRLVALSENLQAAQFRLVNIHRVESDKQVSERFVLHVERIEKHTVESLDRRNMEFYDLARKFNVEKYDGMDVGQVK